MAKFKVGDRVIISQRGLRRYGTNRWQLPEGFVGFVYRVFGNVCPISVTWVVDGEAISNSYYEEDLEHALEYMLDKYLEESNA